MYGRTDRVVCLLAGALAAYLVLVAVVPRLLPSRVAGTGLALTPWILAVLAVALAIRLAWWLRQRAGLVRDLPRAYRHWAEALRDEVLLPFIVERRNKLNPQLLHDFIDERYPLRLIEDVEPRRLVVTDAMTRVSATARNVRSGSIGVSGPRGVGKSTILQFFSAGPGASDGGDLRLFVSAPVDYQPLEFIIHLFSQLCEKVPHGKADRSQLALVTRATWNSSSTCVRTTTSWSASVSPRAFLALARGYSKQRSEQPVTLPELVDTFRAYTGRVAAWHQSKRGGTGRVVIGINEVDKIRDGDRAEAARAYQARGLRAPPARPDRTVRTASCLRQPGVHGGADQPGDHRDRRQQARRHQLAEAEGGPVERVVAGPRPGRSDPRRLRPQRRHRVRPALGQVGGGSRCAGTGGGRGAARRPAGRATAAAARAAGARSGAV